MSELLPYNSEPSQEAIQENNGFDPDIFFSFHKPKSDISIGTTNRQQGRMDSKMDIEAGQTAAVASPFNVKEHKRNLLNLLSNCFDESYNVNKNPDHLPLVYMPVGFLVFNSAEQNGKEKHCVRSVHPFGQWIQLFACPPIDETVAKLKEWRAFIVIRPATDVPADNVGSEYVMIDLAVGLADLRDEAAGHYSALQIKNYWIWSQRLLSLLFRGKLPDVDSVDFQCSFFCGLGPRLPTADPKELLTRKVHFYHKPLAECVICSQRLESELEIVRHNVMHESGEFDLEIIDAICRENVKDFDKLLAAEEAMEQGPEKNKQKQVTSSYTQTVESPWIEAIHGPVWEAYWNWWEGLSEAEKRTHRSQEENDNRGMKFTPAPPFPKQDFSVPDVEFEDLYEPLQDHYAAMFHVPRPPSMTYRELAEALDKKVNGEVRRRWAEEEQQEEDAAVGLKSFDISASGEQKSIESGTKQAKLEVPTGENITNTIGKQQLMEADKEVPSEECLEQIPLPRESPPQPTRVVVDGREIVHSASSGGSPAGSSEGTVGQPSGIVNKILQQIEAVPGFVQCFNAAPPAKVQWYNNALVPITMNFIHQWNDLSGDRFGVPAVQAPVACDTASPYGSVHRFCGANAGNSVVSSPAQNPTAGSNGYAYAVPAAYNPTFAGGFVAPAYNYANGQGGYFYGASNGGYHAMSAPDYGYVGGAQPMQTQGGMQAGTSETAGSHAAAAAEISSDYMACKLCGVQCRRGVNVKAHVYYHLNEQGKPRIVCKAANCGFGAAAVADIQKHFQTALRNGDVVHVEIENMFPNSCYTDNVWHLGGENPESADYFSGMKKHCFGPF